MTPEISTIIGGAGTGKTTHLMNLMEWWLQQDFMSINAIGFCSFTRAARIEAMERAASRFNIPIEDIEKNGWFRTYHACCYRLLNITSASIIGKDRGDSKWLKDAIGEDIDNQSNIDPDEENIFDVLAGKSPGRVALALWNSCRNQLRPLRDVWERAEYCDEQTPSFEHCSDIIEKYEQRKRLDGRIDFTDILGMYSGWRFTINGPVKTQPSGDIPYLSVWFLDEAQDNSALSDCVARRLTANAQHVYICGDPFQSIYAFNGAEPKYFQAWSNPSRTRILNKSYRCAAPILEYGEEILKECSDYWDRMIAPANHDGIVESMPYRAPWPNEINPIKNETWLILARTNRIAARLACRLDANNIPWVPATGSANKWQAPKKKLAFLGLQAAEDKMLVSSEQWKAVIERIPARGWLERGIKTEWAERKVSSTEIIESSRLTEWGATEELMNAIRCGRWASLIEAADFKEAYDKYGLLAIENPKVRVGTIHSAKGMGADSVIVLTTTTHQIAKNCEDRSGKDEEQRLWYVAATRAMRRLIVLREHDARFQWSPPP